MKQNSVKKTAVTGGIGCGKSEIMNILRSLGKKTVSCDQINANLMQEKSYIETVRQSFPTAVIDGKIDKKALSAIIFYSDRQREKLNSIAHPIIKERLIKILSESAEDVFAEVPLLSEGGFELLFDGVWVVTADYEKRVQRIAARDKISLDFARKKIASQTEKQQYCVPTATIINDFDINSLTERIKNLLNE